MDFELIKLKMMLPNLPYQQGLLHLIVTMWMLAEYKLCLKGK